MTPEEILAPVEQSARLLAEARQELEFDVRRAHKEGASLRDIAKAAGMSHESVRRMISADRS